MQKQTLSPAERLLTVTRETSLRAVAAMIADKMVFYAKTEWYRYQINHDIRPPRCNPCPVEYMWSVKDKVGFQTRNKNLAIKWLTNAALYGYNIEEVDGHRKPTSSRTESVDIVRKRAQLHQSMKDNPDDDIPF